MNDNLLNGEIVTRRLLVEGPNDSHVCYHLLKQYGIEEKIEIRGREGINELLKSLRVEIRGSGKRYLGVVVDADNDVIARWQAFRDILINSGYKTIPMEPSSSGTVIQEDGKPIVGIWLMPNNQTSGMIENFLSLLVPLNDPLWSFAEDVLEQVIKQDCRFPEVHKIKAHVHTWLAWQKEPGKPLGQAITKQYFDSSALHAQIFVKWIKQVFDF